MGEGNEGSLNFCLTDCVRSITLFFMSFNSFCKLFSRLPSEGWIDCCCIRESFLTSLSQFFETHTNFAKQECVLVSSLMPVSSFPEKLGQLVVT